MVDELGNT